MSQDESGAARRAENRAPRETLLLCDCEGSAPLDGAAIGAAAGAGPCGVRTALCTNERQAVLDALSAAAAEGGRVTVACAQEAETFVELAEEAAAAAADGAPGPRLATVDVRDRAAWSDEGAAAAPKIAALLAEAALPTPDTPTAPVASEGVCLVYGVGAQAIAAAERLSEAMAVTVMLRETGDADAPAISRAPILTGRIRSASGALGAFEIRADGVAERRPGGRGGLAFETPKDDARSRCDVIVDLSGQPSLFPAPEKRDGYLRADPGDPLAVERALFDAAQLVGDFDKPLHIRFEPSLCAHSRASQPGCDRCLSVCPTGAITVAPGADHVTIDPSVCAGCGACAAVCPSGAALYDDPPDAHLLARMRALSEAYRGAGGAAPRLLIHTAGDAENFGAEMIALAARHGRGLPADVLPLGVAELARVGHPLMLAALALGFESVALLLTPKSERAEILGQIALAERLAAGVGAGGRIQALEPAEPDALSDALYAPAPAPLERAPALLLGEGRALTRAALTALGPAPDAPIDLAGLELPGGAPYGAVLVDTKACTLCLSCVGLCPSGALGDNPDRPELRFQEDACLQCGICASACPEDAIALAPRYDLSDAARAHQVAHSEEPFACISCGAEFGVRSSIERIVEMLQGKHWMYDGPDKTKLIQMCDDCRVNAQFDQPDAPFQLGTPRRPRTTADDLAERAQARPANGRAPDEDPN